MQVAVRAIVICSAYHQTVLSIWINANFKSKKSNKLIPIMKTSNGIQIRETIVDILNKNNGNYLNRGFVIFLISTCHKFI